MTGPVVETVQLRDADEQRYYRQVWYLAMAIRDRGGADEVVGALVGLLGRTRVAPAPTPARGGVL